VLDHTIELLLVEISKQYTLAQARRGSGNVQFC
jgi:hypothetical protein